MSSHVVDLDVSNGVGMREGREQTMEWEWEKAESKEWEKAESKECEKVWEKEVSKQ